MADDPKVRKVTVQLRRPRGGDSGAVAYGYFVVTDGILQMTDAEGNPAGGETGKSFAHHLQPNEDPVGVACKLTRQLRLEFRNGEQRVRGFDGPLNYPKLYCA